MVLIISCVSTYRKVYLNVKRFTLWSIEVKEFVLIFDVPRESGSVAVKVWRDLQKSGSKKLQHSVWKHSDLSRLIEIATFIKKSGGSATILEEKLIF